MHNFTSLNSYKNIKYGNRKKKLIKTLGVKLDINLTSNNQISSLM